VEDGRLMPIIRVAIRSCDKDSILGSPGTKDEKAEEIERKGDFS